MKIFIKLLIFIIILACIAPFLLKGPDGKPLVSADAISLPTLPSWTEIKNKSSRFFNWGGSQQNIQVYKWIDKKGVTHYSDKNDPRYSSTLTEIKPLNVLSTHKMEKAEISDGSVGLTTIPLQSRPKLIDDTKQVKKMMEGREQQIEKALASQ
jgi:hypothetical protein